MRYPHTKLHDSSITYLRVVQSTPENPANNVQNKW